MHERRGGQISSMSALIAISMQSLTLTAAGHFAACVSRARWARSRVPAGIRRW